MTHYYARAYDPHSGHEILGTDSYRHGVYQNADNFVRYQLERNNHRNFTHWNIYVGASSFRASDGRPDMQRVIA